ncbi:hypothetical protein N7467_008928 [Penicillium canescens]|nr:hypothetical protein N7467_008928 [Penicillium canescens]
MHGKLHDDLCGRRGASLGSTVPAYSIESWQLLEKFAEPTESRTEGPDAVLAAGKEEEAGTGRPNEARLPIESLH